MQLFKSSYFSRVSMEDKLYAGRTKLDETAGIGRFLQTRPCLKMYVLINSVEIKTILRLDVDGEIWCGSSLWIHAHYPHYKNVELRSVIGGENWCSSNLSSHPHYPHYQTSELHGEHYSVQIAK